METREINLMTESEVNAKFKELGFDEDRIKRSNTRASGTPKSGIFADIESDVYEGNKYPVLVVVDENNVRQGVVAVGSIMQRIIKGKPEAVEITTKNPLYPDTRYRLKEVNLNDVCGGKTEAELISHLLGKKYTSSNPTHTVYVLQFQTNANGTVKTKSGKRLVDFPKTKEEAVLRIAPKTCFKIDDLQEREN